MRVTLRSIMLVVLAIGLSGCSLIVVALMFVGVPDPVSSVDILWADDPRECETLQVGDAQDQRFVDEPGRYYSAGSIRDPRYRSERDWRRQAGSGSFLVLAETGEPFRRSDIIPSAVGRPEDAARAYFDVNQDGRADLVYEIYGPPFYLRAFVVLPADEQTRAWFERQLGNLRSNWRHSVERRGGYVFETPPVVLPHPTPPRLGSQPLLLRSAGATYLLHVERRVVFDGARRSPPMTLGNPEDDAKATKSALIVAAYRVNRDFRQQRVCTFLGQWMGILLGGF